MVSATLLLDSQRKIVDEEGKEVPQGEVGELLVKGPTVTPGYYRNPQKLQTEIDRR